LRANFARVIFASALFVSINFLRVLLSGGRYSG
jgi:hypothetical protein